MPKVMKRLDEAFEYSAIFYLEKLETDGKLTEGEDRNIDAFRALQKSLRETPPPLKQAISELAEKYPDAFEQSLLSLCGCVNDAFRPGTAAEFMVALVEKIELAAASVSAKPQHCS